MVIAGFRPGSRSTFVSAKVDKAIDAQFGLIRMGWTQEGERTNSLRSDKAHRILGASDPRAEQQASRVEKEMGGAEAGLTDKYAMLTGKDNFFFSIFSNNKLIFCEKFIMSKPKRTENNGGRDLRSVTKTTAGIVAGFALRLMLLHQ